MIIIDREPPVINDCSENIDAATELGENFGTVSWLTPSAIDNSGYVTLDIVEEPSGYDLEIGEHKVTYRFFDDAGNEETCSFTIVIHGTLYFQSL